MPEIEGGCLEDHAAFEWARSGRFELSPRDPEATRRHLADCAACRDKVNACARLDALALAGKQAAPSRPARKLLIALALLALLAGALLLTR